MHLEAELKIAHLNVRREKAGEDDGPVAMDVKLSGVLAIDAIAGLFATPAGFAQLTSLWQPNGELATVEWSGLTMAREGSGLEISFTTLVAESEIKFTSAKLNNIRLTPKPGKVVDFVARTQLTPSDGQITELVELLGQSVGVSVVQPQMEMPLDQAAPKRRGKKADKPASEQKAMALDTSSPTTSVADCDHEWFRSHPGAFHYCAKCQIEREFVEPGYDRDPNKPLPSEVSASLVCAKHKWDVPDDPDAICLTCGASKAEIEFDKNTRFTEPPEEGADAAPANGETIQ